MKPTFTDAVKTSYFIEAAKVRRVGGRMERLKVNRVTRLFSLVDSREEKNVTEVRVKIEKSQLLITVMI